MIGEKSQPIDVEFDMHSFKNMFMGIGTSIQYLSFFNPRLYNISQYIITSVHELNQVSDISPLVELINSHQGKIKKDIQILYRNQKNNIPVKQTLQILLKSKKNLNKIVQEIENKGKIEKFKKQDIYSYFRQLFEVINLTSKYKTIIAKKQLSSYQNLSQKTVIFQFESDEYYLPVEFISSLRDVVLNARKYTNLSGIVYVKFASNQNDDLDVVVHDNGIGIPKEEIQKVHEPYYRASNVQHIKSFGGGIGLTKAKRMCLYYKGDLFIESVLNEYTQITLKIKNHLHEKFF